MRLEVISKDQVIAQEYDAVVEFESAPEVETGGRSWSSSKLCFARWPLAKERVIGIPRHS